MIFTTVSNEPLTGQIWRMRLTGEQVEVRAGQFVEIQLPSFFLRRPISICDAESKDGRTMLTLIYKVVGGGTRELTAFGYGDELDLLVPLGNGYELERSGSEVMLIGGGVGVPPLYLLAKHLRAKGKKVSVFHGFNTASEVFYEREFKELGCKVTVATADGTKGEKGFVTDAIKAVYKDNVKAPYYYACGPVAMLRAVKSQLGPDGEMSMEERMGCGFGVCMGCSIETRSGARRVCKDGPVFKAKELIL
ncbi:MAG: dihydroorotate dehydrogenase electron transfer subunit [Paludibacteraceae bacterium]|nr:dihydroorotate dehydrogenase electron transfer subunit [Paludibacteraceae bacterium]